MIKYTDIVLYQIMVKVFTLAEITYYYVYQGKYVFRS